MTITWIANSSHTYLSFQQVKQQLQLSAVISTMSKYPNGVRYIGGSSYFGSINTANKSNQQTSTNLQFGNNNSRVTKESSISKPIETKKPVAIDTYNKREYQKISNPPSYTYLGSQPTKVSEVERTYLQSNIPLKTPQTLQKKQEESPQPVKATDYNREYFIQTYVREGLNDILERKFNPVIGSLKNYSPKLFDALAVFNTKLSLKLEQFSSIQSLMTIIKTDYLSLNKERILKEGRNYFESNEKTKIQKLPLDTVYEEVKKMLKERPSTAKTNDVRQNYLQQSLQSQLTKKETEIKDLMIKNQRVSLDLREKDDYIAKLNKQMDSSNRQIQKLNDELLKERQKSKEATNKSLKQSELTTQVNQLRADLASYGPYKPSDFQTLKDAKSKSDKEVEMLRDELQKLKAQQQQAQKSSTDTFNLRNENQRLRRQKQSVTNELFALKSKNDENARAKISSQADNDKLKRQLERLRIDYEKLTKENYALKTQASEGAEEKNRKQKEIRGYIEQLQQTKKELDEQRRLSGGKDQRYRSTEDDLTRANRSIAELKSNEKKYQQKLAELTKEISVLTEERDNLNYKIINIQLAKEDYTENKKQKEQMKKALKEKDDEIEKLKNANKTASTNYENIKRSYDSLNASYQQLTNDNKKIAQEKSFLEQSLIQKDKQLSQTSASKSSIVVKSYEADNGKVAVLDNQIKQMKQELAQKEKEILDLKGKLKSANEDISQLSEKEFKLSEELLASCKDVEQLQSKIHNMQRERTNIRNQEKEKYQKQLKQKQAEINDLLHQVETLNQMFGEREGDDRQIEEAQAKRSNDIDKLKAQIQTQEKQIDHLNKTINQLENSLNEPQQRKGTESPIQKLLADNKKLQQKILLLENQANKSSNSGSDQSSRVNHLYQHIILEDQFQYKKFLTEKIESHFRMQIKKTRLVYYFDPLNKVNFHRYIDKVDNLLVIVKTMKGAILAGYSQGSFQPKKTSAHDGLIISITNGKVFTLIQPNQRAITYDDYYLIFGNSEIRIRSQQSKVFSNFGISNSYYASKGEKVSVLLGGTPQQREVETEAYEIYQVFYQ